MKVEEIELQLKSALINTGLVQPVDSTVTKRRGGADLEILCRQALDGAPPWLRLVDQILALQEAAPMSIHVCRRYLRKNGQLVFGWHLGLSGSMSELAATAEAVCGVLAAARPTLTQQAPRKARGRAAAAARQAELDEAGEEGGDAYDEAQEGEEGRPHRPPDLAPGQRPPPEAGVIAPGRPARVAAPEGFSPTIKVVRNEVDDEGRVRIEEEMPLPHVYRELNHLSDGGRGAALSGSGNFHPARTRRR